MKLSLDAAALATINGPLAGANAAYAMSFPGDPTARQPLHTVYGGAQLFSKELPAKLGSAALRHLHAYAPDAASMAAALGMDPDLAARVYPRVVEKLEREPVEDFRIDFEDGFGIRPDAEEDVQAGRCAAELAEAVGSGTAPPFYGIRIKNLGQEMAGRALRTLDLFVTGLVAASGGHVPEGFVITVPKITSAAQVTAVATACDLLEAKLDVAEGSLKLELMVELPQTLLDPAGRCVLPDLVAAARGRCTGAHFGTYDYTASVNITAAHQVMDHPSCAFALHLMQVALSGRGVFLSDGATNVMPVGPHRGPELSPSQQAENAEVVHRAWRLSAKHIANSLRLGFYQGWDLHPGQLPVRYAASYAFFLAGLEPATERLSNFVEKAGQATLVGDVFDDAATGQGLLNYFLRALACGAISLEEAEATGLSAEEIRGRSFLAILERQRAT